MTESTVVKTPPGREKAGERIAPGAIEAGAIGDGVIDEQALIARALAGDATAVEQLLLHHYEPLLRSIAKRIPRSLAGAVHPEDILQQTYLKAFRSIDRFEPRSEHSFYAWLKVIAQRHLLDEIRKHAKDPLGPGARRHAPKQDASSSTMMGVSQFLEDGGMLPNEAAHREELLRAMQVALATLDPHYVQAIELRYFKNYSKERVAAELGVGIDALRGILFRARKKLKESIGRLSVYI